MDKRRKHHKITTFPQEIVEEVNRLLVEGHTYEEVASWLNKMGHEVGKSSVGRYGKDFMARLDRLKVVRDQAKAIVESNQDAPGTQLAEAANELAISMIMETLSELDSLEGQKVTELLKVLPKLADASTRREALKMQFNKGVEAAAAKIMANLKAEIEADPDLQTRMMELVEKSKQQCIDQVR